MILRCHVAQHKQTAKLPACLDCSGRVLRRLSQGMKCIKTWMWKVGEVIQPKEGENTKIESWDEGGIGYRGGRAEP